VDPEPAVGAVMDATKAVIAAEVERYHAVIFDCLKDESPAWAERIVLRLQRLNSQYLR
jgi:hypothetical protein